MQPEIYDAYLQHWLSNYIGTLSYSERLQLKNLRLCNKHINGAMDGVYIMSDGKHSRLAGICSCKNSFACPTCSAIIMKKHRTNIAVAIEALAKQGYEARMFTFAIPHLKFQTCKEVTDILYESWIKMTRNKSATRKRKDGAPRWCNVFNKFFVESEVKYYIRIAEYTYGVNGWNPHFHMLFWAKKDKAAKFKDYETELERLWMSTVKKVTSLYYQQVEGYRFPTGISSVEELVQKVFHAEDAPYSMTISDRPAKSSDYISGWGSDSELTGNYRKQASHEGHYTPYQILEMAAKSTEWAEVYKEFMLNVTRKPVHHRAEYSKGLHQLIAVAKNRDVYREQLLQKKSESVWVCVGRFSPEQWSRVVDLDKFFPIISNVLYLATSFHDVLDEYLAYYGISLSKIETHWSRLVSIAYNSAA